MAKIGAIFHVDIDAFMQNLTRTLSVNTVERFIFYTNVQGLHSSILEEHWIFQKMSDSLTCIHGFSSCTIFYIPTAGCLQSASEQFQTGVSPILACAIEAVYSR